MNYLFWVGLALIAFGIVDIRFGLTDGWLPGVFPTAYEISPTMSITGVEVIFFAVGAILMFLGAK